MRPTRRAAALAAIVFFSLPGSGARAGEAAPAAQPADAAAARAAMRRAYAAYQAKDYAGFLREADAGDLHGAVSGLQHVVDGERGDRDGGERFHFNTGRTGDAYLRADMQPCGHLARREFHGRLAEGQGMAKGNQFRGLLCGQDSCQSCGRQHVAFRDGILLDQPVRRPPQADFPGTSFFLQDRLGVGDTPCFDLRAQCSGFVFSLSVVKALIEAGQFRRVLVVGCEVHSTGIDVSDAGRDVAVLFGDGAGAAVVEANPDASNPSAILEVRLHAEGRYADKLWIEAPGSGFQPVRITHELIDQRRHFPRMEGRFVFKHAVTRMPEVLLEALNAASLKLADVDLFLFHQANLRINEYVAQQLEIPAEKCLNNIERYGNCSAASIPIALFEAAEAGKLDEGDNVVLVAFGGGLAWAAGLVRWGTAGVCRDPACRQRASVVGRGRQTLNGAVAGAEPARRG